MTLPRICDPAPVPHAPGYWQSLHHAQPERSAAHSVPDSGETVLLFAQAILAVAIVALLSSSRRRN